MAVAVAPNDGVVVHEIAVVMVVVEIGDLRVVERGAILD